MTKTTIAVFPLIAGADTAISQLHQIGVGAERISVLMKESTLPVDSKSKGEKVAESAVSGATTGGIIGTVAGLLVGVGAITIPGIGAILIGGPLATALGLTGAAATTLSGAVTGAVAGGVLGGLTELGIPKEKALVMEERIKKGEVLLAVSTEGVDEDAVERILKNNGGEEITKITQ